MLAKAKRVMKTRFKSLVMIYLRRKRGDFVIQKEEKYIVN